MTQYLMVCRSLTYAQRALKQLETAGLSVSLVKAPRSLVAGGCGYGLSLYRNLEKAAEILERSKLMPVKIYSREDGGEFREMRL